MTAHARRALRLILGITLAAGGVAFVWDAFATPLHEAQARFQIPREVWDLAADSKSAHVPLPFHKHFPSQESSGLSVSSPPELVLEAPLWQTVLRRLEAAAAVQAKSTREPNDIGREPFWQAADPAAALSQGCRLLVEERAGLDDVTICYTSTESQGAVPVVQAVLQTILEACPTSAQRTTLDPAREAEKVRQKTAIDRQRLACAELRTRQNLSPLDKDRREIGLEQAKSLAGSVAECRRQRLIAENRLVQVRRDLESGVSLELVATRLPAAESQRVLQELAAQEKLRVEAQQLQHDSERLSAIYGRNHPHMRDLREKQADFQARVRTATGQGGDIALTAAQQPVLPDRAELARWMLHLLDSERQDLRATERDLQAQLDAETAALDSFAEQQRELQRAEQELAKLEAVGEELAKPAVLASKSTHAGLQTVSPPALLSADSQRGLWSRLLWCMSGGLVLGLLIELGQTVRTRPQAVSTRTRLPSWNMSQPATIG